MAGAEAVVIYQNLLEASDGLNAGEVFFELANEKLVAYRTKLGHVVQAKQFPSIEDSTGGIIWETSYFFTTFIEENSLPPPGTNFLEVGSGCGLLGLVMAHYGCHVVCTECTETLQVLSANVDAGAASVEQAGGSVKAKLLRWEDPSDRAALVSGQGAPSSFDVIAGTDVFFDKSLVAPLLDTMASLAHADTKVWLCFQERCAAGEFNNAIRMCDVSTLYVCDN